MELNAAIAIAALIAAVIVGFGAAFMGGYYTRRNRFATEQFEIVKGLGRAEAGGMRSGDNALYMQIGELREGIANIREDSREIKEAQRAAVRIAEEYRVKASEEHVKLERRILGVERQVSDFGAQLGKVASKITEKLL